MVNDGARGTRSGGERAGKGVGKVEELTRNPFPWSIWVEEDRRSGSTRRGGARAALPWRSAVGPSIPAAKGSSKVRGGAVEVRNTVGEALAEGNGRTVAEDGRGGESRAQLELGLKGGARAE